MKNYKKGLLAASVLASMAVFAATTPQDDRIHVTTFADENGENSNACSLREAITAAAQNKPYGGCTAGKTNNSVTDQIVLPKGEYILNKSLTPSSQVNIQGAEASDWGKKDVITGDYPARLAPVTTIKGNGQFPLFDTSAGKGTLNLNALNLMNGGGKKGGAIFAGAATYLNSVHVKNNSATESGGAIYLAGVGSALEVKDSLFENNMAPHGAVLAMTCLDNLTFTERTLKFTNASIINNGSNTTRNVIEICGKAATEFTNNTIALNNASTSNGSILKFTGDSQPNSQQASILSNSSALTLLNNTIINNTAYSSFLYDSIASKSLSYNLMAYNNGYSCRHLLGPLDKEKNYNIGSAFNALIQLPTKIGFCDVVYPEKATENNNIDLSNVAQNSILTALQPANQFTAYLPMYFLRTGNNPLVDIKDSENCSSTDQRSKVRLSENKLIYDLEVQNTCDIGAVEQANLKAADVAATNTSQIEVLKNFEKERDFFKDLVDDKNVSAEFLPYYKLRHQEFVDKLAAYPKSFRYRQAYVDIFAQSLPYEKLNAQGALEIQHFVNTKLYKVDVEAIGTGPDVFASGVVGDLPDTKDPNLQCKWDESVERVVLYRTDGRINQAGDYSYCKYTLSLKADPKIKSVGLAQAQFVNIAPVAKDDEFTLNWGTSQRIQIDVLANDHDDGDGKAGQPFYPQGKKTFYTDSKGISAPIKFSKLDANLEFEAQYQALCPDESGQMCYGGTIFIKPKNSFNKFNYSLTYEVYDADATVSNTATVKLINTATTTEDTRKGGSGSIGLLGFLGLGALAFIRRRKTNP